jgi:superfamily II DNA or RNA helicase
MERNNTNYPLYIKNYLNNIKYDKKEILQYHQKLVTKFFIEIKNHRGLLLFHGTGRGKTMVAVSIADVLSDHMDVVILSSKSLRSNFIKEVDKYSKLTGSDIKNNYSYISSNAGNMMKQMNRIGKNKKEIELEESLRTFNGSVNLDNKMIIVDEAQNLFNGIVSGGENALSFYNSVMKSKNIKLIFLSATPIINDPFEIVPLYNMLHGKSLLPEDYNDFYDLYINKEKGTVKNRNSLKNRLYGLTSYMGDWWQSGGVWDSKKTIDRGSDFPKQLPTKLEVIKMSTLQYNEYSSARDKETSTNSNKKTITNNMRKPKSSSSSSYRVASRQISNFLLPPGVKNKNSDKNMNKKNEKDLSGINKHHMDNLEIYSPKMKKIYENVNKSKGLCIVYSSFVNGEGLKIFSMILKHNGWDEYRANRYNKPSDKQKFSFITGNQNINEISEIMKLFNHKRNINGKDIRLILLSSAGAEGFDFKNVMSVHIMEPYWNFGRIEQIIARAVRYKSHDDYKNKSDRKVQPYIYLSDYPDKFDNKHTKRKELTTDLNMYYKSIKNKLLINRFYSLMIESSLDCSIHIKKSPDDIKQKIKCLECIPTNNKLFHDDYEMDIKLGNNCINQNKTEIVAKEIEYNDIIYYFHKDENNIINIYSYNTELDYYIQINNTHQDYYDIIEHINDIKDA